MFCSLRRAYLCDLPEFSAKSASTAKVGIGDFSIRRIDHNTFAGGNAVLFLVTRLEIEGGEEIGGLPVALDIRLTLVRLTPSQPRERLLPAAAGRVHAPAQTLRAR